ncbi:hypothetical protein, partial [Algoriphagus litoralis]|uniref:hypothetical protein n=1 Tax=Algoriphagus litoralis TaxID=2202829 RepID=UPI001E599D9F
QDVNFKRKVHSSAMEMWYRITNPRVGPRNYKFRGADADCYHGLRNRQSINSPAFQGWVK